MHLQPPPARLQRQLSWFARVLEDTDGVSAAAQDRLWRRMSKQARVWVAERRAREKAMEADWKVAAQARQEDGPGSPGVDPIEAAKRRAAHAGGALPFPQVANIKFDEGASGAAECVRTACLCRVYVPCAWV